MGDIIKELIKRTDLTENKSLQTMLYEGLKEAIILGEILRGERIIEQRIAEELNVSRTPLRAALNMLEKEKLVERIRGQGIIVIGISHKDTREIFELRLAIETMVTNKAFQVITDEQLSQMEQLLRRGNEYYRNNDLENLKQNFHEFNEFMYQVSDMRLSKMIIDQLKEYLAYFRSMSIMSSTRGQAALEEHWEIYYAFEQRNEELLMDIIAKHLWHSENFILNEMAKRNNFIDNRSSDS